MGSAHAPLPQELRERLEARWRENLERLAEEWFGDWRRESEAEFAAYLEEALRNQSAALRKELCEQMTQDARGLRAAENHAAWVRALLAAACRYSPFAALFSTLSHRLRCEGMREAGVEEGEYPLIGLDIPLSSAPAFGHAVESSDPVATVVNAEELSESVAEHLAPRSSGAAYLLPLVSHGRVAAVLYVEPGGDAAARASLEWLALAAGLTLEQRTPAPGQLVTLTPALEPPKPQVWEALPKEERQLHVQAQRFAKWKASSIRLSQREAVREGIRKQDLYSVLRNEIDSAREEYRRRFMEQSPHMVDYLHIELVRTLANDDSAQLGPDYPGPLV